MDYDATVTGALDDLGTVLRAVEPDRLEAALRLIATARSVMVYGCGREGFQLRGLAQRLHHLGFTVAMQGDVAAPPLGPGDLFLTSAGPGQLSTVTALIGTAQAAGASVLLLTAEPDRAPEADVTLVIPAQTMARDTTAPTTTLPMGSLYEGAMFLLFEAMILDLRARLAVTPEAMRARHTNME